MYVTEPYSTEDKSTLFQVMAINTINGQSQLQGPTPTMYRAACTANHVPSCMYR